MHTRDDSSAQEPELLVVAVLLNANEYGWNVEVSQSTGDELRSLQLCKKNKVLAMHCMLVSPTTSARCITNRVTAGTASEHG